MKIIKNLLVLLTLTLCVSACGPSKPSNPDNPTVIGGGEQTQPQCNNGVVEAGEKCDTLISNGPGQCPTETSCKNYLQGLPEAQKQCKVAKIVGTECTQECVLEDITACNSVSDGCCPAGCNANNDPDCQPRPGDKCDITEDNCKDAPDGKQTFCSGPTIIFHGMFDPPICYHNCKKDTDCGTDADITCAKPDPSQDGFCTHKCTATGNECIDGYECKNDACIPIDHRECTTDDDCTKKEKEKYGNKCLKDPDPSVTHKTCQFRGTGTVALGGSCTKTSDCAGDAGMSGVGVICLPTKADGSGVCYQMCEKSDCATSGAKCKCPTSEVCETDEQAFTRDGAGQTPDAYLMIDVCQPPRT